MHETASIANQSQSSPAAAASEALAVPEINDQEPELIQRYPIQFKLAVGAADDPMEHEADAMADKVMRMPESHFSQHLSSPGPDTDNEQVRLKPLASQITPFVQRCTACGDYDDEHVQLKPIAPVAPFDYHKNTGPDLIDDDQDNLVQLKPMSNDVTPFIQRCGACNSHDDEHVQLKPISRQGSPLIQAKSDGANTATEAVSGGIKSTMGGGSPLQSDTRNFMESRFGADFSRVKIHTGEESAKLNQALNAKAFAFSNNIYFNNGQYQPETDGGKRLLAHELTHVVQQSGPSDLIQREIDTPDKGGFKRLQIIQTTANNSLDFMVMLEFEKGSVTYPFRLDGNKFLRPGAYNIMAATNGQPNPDPTKFELFFVKENKITIVLGTPDSDKSLLADLHNAAAWLAKDATRSVPMLLVPFNDFDDAGKGGEGEGGSGGQFVAAEPWLEKEMLPAINAIYAAKAYVNKPDKLIPYQSVAIQKAEGNDISMIQSEKKGPQGKVVVHVRVNKKNWVNRSIDDQQKYAASTAEEIINKIETSLRNFNKNSQKSLKEEGPNTREDGVKANSPAYRSDIVGPEIMVKNATGAYTMRLHYEDFDKSLLGSAAEAYGGADYTWQIFDISKLYEQIISERNAKAELQKLELDQNLAPSNIGKTAGEKELDKKGISEGIDKNRVTKYSEIGRKAQRVGKDLAEDKKQAENDLLHPLDSQDGSSGAAVRAVLVNSFNLATTNLHTIMSYGALLVQSIPTVFDNNHDYSIGIPFPDAEGHYLVRCVAQPRPKNDIVHLSSLAVKVVTVKNIQEHAKKELNNQDKELQSQILNLLIAYRQEKAEDKLKNIRMELEWKVQDAAQTNRSFLDEEIKSRQELLKGQRLNDDARKKIEEEIKILQQGTGAESGTIALIITRQIQIKEHELEELEKHPTGDYFKIRELKRELETLRNRLGTAVDREREMTKSGYNLVRPQAVFVNEEDGRTIPLLIEIAQTGIHSANYGYRMRLSDVAGADGDTYNAEGTTRAIAVNNLLKEYAGHFPFGRGYMVVRIPESSGYGITGEITLRCNPRDLAQASERLDELIQVLTVLGIFAPGVGVAAAAMGAAVSAVRILHRISNHSFEPDINFVMDLLNILAFVASGVTHLANAKVAKTRDFFVLAQGDADIAEWTAKLSTARNLAKAAEITEEILNKSNYMLGTMETVKAYIETQNDEINGKISHSEARSKRAKLAMQALNDAIMQHAGEIGEAIKEHSEESRQRNQDEKNRQEKKQREKEEQKKKLKEKDQEKKNNEDENEEHTPPDPNKKNNENKNKDNESGGGGGELNRGTVVHPVKETAVTRNARAEAFLGKRENQMGIIKGDMEVVGKLLKEHGVWRDLMMYLLGHASTGNDLFAVAIDELVTYRDAIVKDLKENPAYRLELSAPASTKASSDVDLAAKGDDAGSRLLKSEEYMRNTYGDSWSDLLRMNFYTEAERLFKYEGSQKLMGDKFGELQREISDHAEVLNFAKMLQHAGKNEASVTRIEDLMHYLPEAQRAKARELAKETPPQSQAVLKKLLLNIDELVTRRGKLSESDPAHKEEIIKLDREITLAQMEANFRTVEAYISPGAGRHVVRKVAVTGHEAYQSCMANLEMIEHVIHIAGGDVEAAIREYELYKYVNRIIVASATAGVHLDPFMMAYYNASHDIYNNQPERGSLQRVNAKDHAYIKAMHEHFTREMQSLLPKLKEKAQNNDAAWNPDKQSLQAEKGSIGNKVLMPDAEGETKGVSDADIDKSIDKTFGLEETETALPGHKKENINGVITDSTADGQHKLTVTKDGKIYRCSECEQLLSNYQEVLEVHGEIKTELLLLEQTMKVLDEAGRTKLLAEKVKPLEDKLRILEEERLRSPRPADVAKPAAAVKPKRRKVKAAGEKAEPKPEDTKVSGPADEASAGKKEALTPEGPTEKDKIADAKAQAKALKAAQAKDRESEKSTLQNLIGAERERRLEIITEIEELNEKGRKRLTTAERNALDAEKAGLAREANASIAYENRLRANLENLDITPYDRARAYSYSDVAANAVVKRSKALDEFSGKKLTEPSIEHLVSVTEISEMAVEAGLSWEDTKALLNRQTNLFAMEKVINSSKGNLKVAQWENGKISYGETKWREMIQMEAAERAAMKVFIQSRKVK